MSYLFEESLAGDGRPDRRCGRADGSWKSTASDAKDGGTDAENPLIIDLDDTFVEV